MTIRSYIDARALNTELESFERCADESPAGTYEQAKELAELIGRIADDLIRGLRAIGMQADNCDGIREVEAVIYGWIKNSNPDATVFPTAEGFGDSLGGPARERVLAQAVQNRDFLQSSFAAFGPVRGIE
ncbi:hypothetical protein [Xanthomonas oryzae]|uniref:hypothetical protein n=1 Tax=Xanthomonas oryzae TaxID=347 RepID=UPI003DA1AC0E